MTSEWEDLPRITRISLIEEELIRPIRVIRGQYVSGEYEDLPRITRISLIEEELIRPIRVIRGE